LPSERDPGKFVPLVFGPLLSRKAAHDFVALSREIKIEARQGIETQLPDAIPFSRGAIYKYQPKVFADLLHEAGFSDARFWTDDQRWFGVYSGQA
jgi:Histidine-specific methyltransferase, SAM-dependent